MTHPIELPDHVYELIRRAAEKEGLTPAEWIEATVSRVGAPADETTNDRSLRESLANFIGAVDSSQSKPDPRRRTEFGDILAEKFRRQGLEIP